MTTPEPTNDPRRDAPGRGDTSDAANELEAKRDRTMRYSSLPARGQWEDEDNAPAIDEGLLRRYIAAMRAYERALASGTFGKNMLPTRRTLQNARAAAAHEMPSAEQQRVHELINLYESWHAKWAELDSANPPPSRASE
jgi:hypothetical protein